MGLVGITKRGENILNNCNIIRARTEFPIKASLERSHNFSYAIFKSKGYSLYFIGLRYTPCLMKKDNECILELYSRIYRSYTYVAVSSS